MLKKMLAMFILAAGGCLAGLNCLGQEPATATNEFSGTLDGKEFTRDWKIFKGKTIQVHINSTGGMQAKFLKDNQPLAYSISLAAKNQGGTNPRYWQRVKTTVLPDDGGLVIEGVNPEGLNITQRITMSSNAVNCAYETDRAIELGGQFPYDCSVNWFWAKTDQGEIQGELWGDYAPISIKEVFELTYIAKRVRLSVPKQNVLELRPAADAYSPPSFVVTNPTARSENTEKYRVSLEIAGLDPEQAPLHDGADIPMATKPFDKNKLIRYPEGSAGIYTNVVIQPVKGYPAIFKPAEELSFKIGIANPPSRGNAGSVPSGSNLAFKCFYSLDNSLKEEGLLSLKPGDREGALKLTAKVKGPYWLEVRQGSNIIGRDEFVVVGSVEQRVIAPNEKNPFKLKLVDSINCAADNGKHEFYTYSQKAKINEAPRVGKFMESAAETKVGFVAGGFEWFGYKVTGLAKDKPHLLEVEYPDIDDMVMSIQVGQCRKKEDNQFRPMDGPERAFTLLGGGVISGLGNRLTGTLQKFTGVFYPYHDWALLEFGNYSKDNKPVRVSKINIYEIEDDIPMVESPDKDNNRIIGVFTEDPSHPLGSFCRAGFLNWECPPEIGGCWFDVKYKWYYLAAERMVKYLRYRGENTWYVGAYRFGSSVYPSFMARNGGNFGEKTDVIALFARMFEENGLTLVLGVPFTGGDFWLQLKDRYTDEDVRAGKPTIRQVTDEGQQPSRFESCFNPFQPAVKEIMGGLAGELAGRYDAYPAVKAIAFVAGLDGCFQPSFATRGNWVLGANDKPEDSYFRTSYDDYTIQLFEKEKKVKVDVPNTPNRFKERRSFIEKNLKQAWIDFRCEQMRDTKAGIAQAIRAKSKRLEFYAFDYFHTQEYVFARDKDNLYNKLKNIGTDLALYKAGNDFAYGYFFAELNAYYESNMCWLPMKDRESFRTMNLDASTSPYIEENANMGAWLGRQFFEGAPAAAPHRKWCYHQLDDCKYILPGNRGALEDFALILSRCTPRFICHYWCDQLMPDGHAEQIREFAAAYRAIPAGKFKTVYKNNYPGICVRALDSAAKVVFYVVNTADSRRRAIVETKGKLREMTKNGDEIIKADKGFEVSLDTFALRVFEIKKGKLDAAHEVMTEAERLSAEAKVSARTEATEAEKKRALADRETQQETMVILNKLQKETNKLQKEESAVKTNPPSIPCVRVPRLASAIGPGDLSGVDWTKGVILDGWRQVSGKATARKIQGHLIHDDACLYIRLEEAINPSTLDAAAVIWNGDDWELFFAPERGKRPYFQIVVNPAGKFESLRYDPDQRLWKNEVRVVSNTNTQGWQVIMAVPLISWFPGEIKAGQKLYANFYRVVPGASFREYLAWSPPLEENLHNLDRLGEIIFE